MLARVLPSCRRGFKIGHYLAHSASFVRNLSDSDIFATNCRTLLSFFTLWWATPPPAPTGGYVHKGVLAGGAGGRSPPGKKIADFSTVTRIFHGRRRRGTPRASERFMCQRCGACPRERLPCRPPGRLRAGAPLQPASWPHRLSSLLDKLFPFIRAAEVGRSRPCRVLAPACSTDWAS